MSSSIITLYDAACREGKPLGWNAMGMKARFALNFKGLKYRTVWLEYPDIEPTMKRIGASPGPTKPDGRRYTIPVIVDPVHAAPDGTPIPITDSWKIAEYLDEKYPEPGLLFPSGTKALQSLFHDYAMTNVLYKAIPMMLYSVWGLLSDESQVHWRTYQEAACGAKLEDLCPVGSQKWEAQSAILQKSLSDLAAILDKNGTDGPFVLGAQVTFADFILVSMLEMISKVIPDEWEKIIQHLDNGRWQKARVTCSAWIQADNIR
ncbi:hypothetical protein BU17DRAFT_56204 [Hysterangium stoloniferum]|nr:hypothetical protein BU17DRAFT_56204 [Hysterangium stoloniferum]